MKREEDESYEDYRERRTAENKRVKKYLRGRVIWSSYFLGAYVRPENRGK